MFIREPVMFNMAGGSSLSVRLRMAEDDPSSSFWIGRVKLQLHGTVNDVAKHGLNEFKQALRLKSSWKSTNENRHTNKTMPFVIDRIGRVRKTPRTDLDLKNIKLLKIIL